ncbi:MAG: CapA family protein [Chloroflexota bacterium]
MKKLTSFAAIGGMVLFLSGFLQGCGQAADNLVPLPTQGLAAVIGSENTPQPLVSDNREIDAESTIVPKPTIQPTFTPSPTPEPWRLKLDGGIPAEARQDLTALPANQFVLNDDEPDIELIVGSGQSIGRWVYALVAPFNTLRDGVSSAEMGQLNLVGTAETVAVWQDVYPQITIVPKAELVQAVWDEAATFAIVPFHELTPDLKVMSIDGLSPLKKELNVENYPLKVNIGVEGEPAAVDAFMSQRPFITNRDEEKMTRIAMTGVTALVRATAAQMEYSGILFPGEVVAPILQAADVAHVSNEVPFAENCPFPNAVSQSVVFCSRDSYFQLLEHLGTDIVEVTGNHSNDYGTDAMLRSLEKYVDAGMNYYGGGRDLSDSFQPAYVYDHGNKIAFVGCNSFGPVGAWATADRPGTAPCGDFSKIASVVSQLAAEGYVVIVTFQYAEIYSYQATAAQKRDFKLLAEAGAAAVSGSQSHHPQQFDFHNGAYIHYGLGNLFFDQMFSLGTRQMFIDEYVVYDSRLVGVELWTGLIEYYSRPREMTAAEREALLRSVFNASGWAAR